MRYEPAINAICAVTTDRVTKKYKGVFFKRP